MPTNGLRRTLDRLRKALTPDRPDEQLLREFIAARDETAFATLVRRHGQMVLAVSRRVLGNLHDSEDVFQATFLVLAQKAHWVSKREAVASWLYKVAYRIALKARAKNDRRRQMERKAAMFHPQAPAPVVHDWEAALDEELNRLPEKYRLPVILCDLDGCSRKDAERRLGLAEGTLSSRLTRGRRMLAERLARHGITLSASALAAMASEATAAATLPPGLVGSTATTAVLVAAGKFTAVSGSVLVLMKIGAKAMFLAKLKATLATTVVLAFVSGGIVYSGGAKSAGPKSELEELRRENALLKVNLRVTLEKIEVMEKEIASLKGQASKMLYAERVTGVQALERAAAEQALKRVATAQQLAEIVAERQQRAKAEVARAEEAARAAHEKAESQRQLGYFRMVETLQKAQANQNDRDARQRAIDALEKALKELRQGQKDKKFSPRSPTPPGQ
jgi:RNA polymerase sigma factor (sigma-70 family)